MGRQPERTRTKEWNILQRREKQEEDFDGILSGLNGRTMENLEEALTTNESQILRELAEGIRAIRYGSIVLVVHDGRLVEVTKTVRLRTSRASQKE
jgi:hypothetical protein